MIDKAIAVCADCFAKGGTLLVCGNGGSAADSAHIVGEMVKGFLKKRPAPAAVQAAGGPKLQRGLPAIDLTAQGAVISAIQNDLGGEYVYAQQVLAYGKPGDVLIGISTSGNAENVLRAMRVAKALGMTRIAMTGSEGGALKDECDVWLASAETETYLVQEEHIRFYHRICAEVEARFFPE